MSFRLNEFLKENGLDAARYDFEEEVTKFLANMDAGLAGEPTLPMLPTYVGVPDVITPNSKVLAIDLGGTNLRAGLIGFDENAEASILEIHKRKMPGIESEVKAEEVFDAIAEMTKDFVNEVDQVGFCFSNSFEILEDGDAKVLHFGKELKVEGMVGCLLIKSLKDAWGRRGITKKVAVTVLNDSVSTLLMGKLQYPQRQISESVGLILGTGMNISYVEANENITKVKGLIEGRSQIINTECGDYAGFERCRFDEMLDETTTNKGKYFMEKTMSGAFVGRLTAIIINEAVKEGIIPDSIPEDLSSKDMNDFLVGKGGESNPLIAICRKNPENFGPYFEVMDAVLERAAKFAAIAMVAIVCRFGVKDNFYAPVLMSIDGSGYAGEYFCRERIEAYLHKYLKEERNIAYHIVRPKNASLLGASVAALGSLFTS